MTSDGLRKVKPFLVSHRGAATSLSIESLRKDLTEVMRQANIEEIWTPHDIRGAVASKLINLQAGDARVLQLGRWKSRRTLDLHYFKQAFYAEADPNNVKKPLRELLRMKVTQIDRAAYEEKQENQS
jgi:hypothetical protein